MKAFRKFCQSVSLNLSFLFENYSDGASCNDKNIKIENISSNGFLPPELLTPTTSIWEVMSGDRADAAGAWMPAGGFPQRQAPKARTHNMFAKDGLFHHLAPTNNCRHSPCKTPIETANWEETKPVTHIIKPTSLIFLWTFSHVDREIEWSKKLSLIISSQPNAFNSLQQLPDVICNNN